MPGSVTFERHDDVALLRLSNPPVNGLSFAMRAALGDRVAQALADDAVKAIVIAGADRMFCGGADIREFSAPPPPGAAHLPAILDEIEASPKPVVAAIHGVAAGGGMEVALACHVRLAAPGTRLGLPEVTLGILPGAGGTQRMPRLIGIEKALDVIVGGKLHPVEKAVALGFVDECVEGDLLATAIARACQLAADGTPLRRASRLTEHLEAARGRPEIFDDFRKKMAKRARGFDAPYACVDCVETALTMPYAEALKNERVVFHRLRESDQSAAQRHAFFAEREVAKIPDVPRDTAVRPIASAGVVGCGTMGGGIAMSIANAGLPVTVLESSPEALDRGMAIIRKNYAATVSKGRLSQTQMDARLARITPTLDDADLGAADVVIEAVFEELPLKKEVFARLDRVCRPEAILATNTSTLDVDAIAAATSRPAQVIGTHFFSPANVMRLMENVRGARTSPETIATVMKLSKKLGKVGVLVGVCDGFVGNRMLYAYRRQADFLLEEGALPEQI
ncbi:MAG: 3-hydroxyacyl-CoA dehydrogenase NAD-binding domain-containing protein, partial [Acidobacteriota bacterium]|nr:3-hydroxyacyl-CoA dehydrogenase NAD-binding domain-containing protein [Acidobacteriota bacterium]